jgi:hypothetical protein
VRPNQITDWKNRLVARSARVYDGAGRHAAEPPIDV